MQTLTTKQLRENLPTVIEQLRQGYSVQLTYRRKVIGVLQPTERSPEVVRRGSSAAIKSGLAALRQTKPLLKKADERPIKEQIAEYRNRKYGA